MAGRRAPRAAANRRGGEAGFLRAARARGGRARPPPPPRRHATSLGSMLTLQELGGETVADREARRHGHDMLAALAELQRALLGGGDDRAALQRLARSGGGGADGHRSAAGRHGLGDRPAGTGGAGAPAAERAIVACQLVEACSRALGGAIGHRYKPAQLRSRRAGGFRGFRQAQGGSAARGKAGPARHDGYPTPRLPTGRG